MPPPWLVPVVQLLERSQTCEDPAIDAELINHLADADARVEQQAAWEPAELQQLMSLMCSWIRAHEASANVPCVSVAMRFLAKLMGRDSAADNIAIQKGLISSTTSLLSGHNDAAILKSCLEVLVTLSTVESTDTIINRAGSVGVIVELMRKHQGSPPVLEDAATALAVMSIRSRHRRSILQSGGVNVAVDELKRYVDVPVLVVAICRFLSGFAVKDDCRTAIVQSGGVHALMAAFKSPMPPGVRGSLTSVDVRATIAAAMWACSTDCNDAQNALLEGAGLSALAAVLRSNPTHAGLHEATLGIVRGLSRNAPLRQEIVSLGFVTAAIHAVRSFKGNQVLLKEACGVFGNLAADPELRVQLGESGVIQEVVAVLSTCRNHEDRKAVKLALGALMNLSSCDENREVIANCEAIPVLLEATRFFMQNEMILEFAIGVVSHVAMHSSCNSQLIKAGAVEALLLFLEDHHEDLAVVSRALVALRRLLKFLLSEGDDAPAVSLLQQISSAGQANGCRGISTLGSCAVVDELDVSPKYFRSFDAVCDEDLYEGA